MRLSCLTDLLGRERRTNTTAASTANIIHHHQTAILATTGVLGRRKVPVHEVSLASR